MTLLNGATDTSAKDQVRELAGLLAKGFLGSPERMNGASGWSMNGL